MTEPFHSLADTVPLDRHPRRCSLWFSCCDCGLASETTVEGLYQYDLGRILIALGLGDYARSESAHMVVHDVVLPAIAKLSRGPS